MIEVLDTDITALQVAPARHSSAPFRADLQG
jgi:hypothetical protein